MRFPVNLIAGNAKGLSNGPPHSNPMRPTILALSLLTTVAVPAAIADGHDLVELEAEASGDDVKLSAEASVCLTVDYREDPPTVKMSDHCAGSAKQ